MLASRAIAQDLQALLVAAATDAGARWHLGRAWPLATLPAGRVVLEDEDLEADDEGPMIWPRHRAHTLSVSLQCVVSDSADPEAAADQLAEQALLAVEGTSAPLGAEVIVAATGLQRQLATEGQAHVAITTVRLRLQFGGRSDDPTAIV